MRLPCQAAKNRQVKNLPSNLMPLHSPVGLLGKPWCIKNNPDLSNVNRIIFQSIQVAVIKDPEPLNFQHLSSFTAPHPHPIPHPPPPCFSNNSSAVSESDASVSGSEDVSVSGSEAVAASAAGWSSLGSTTASSSSSSSSSPSSGASRDVATSTGSTCNEVKLKSTRTV